MDLKVMILNSHFSQPGNYFIVGQIDELIYPEKEHKTQKSRTDIISKTSNPIFKKNMFTFTNLSFTNRITIKFGVFQTSLLSDPGDNQKLMANAKIVGSTQFTFTQKFIKMLRSQKKIEQDVQVISGSKKEVGRLGIALKYKANQFEAKIQDDNSQIQQVYYDIFESDETVIKEKCAKVESLLISKQEEYNKYLKKLNFMRSAHKTVSYDQGKLEKEKDQLEKDTYDLRKQIDKSNDVNEIHIHIDLLKNTQQGVEVIKQKLALLMNKLAFERSIYNELSEHYYHLENQIQVSKDLQTEIQTVKEAGEHLSFHLKRAKDLYPTIQNQKNTIMSQESIIKNLQSMIQTHLKNNDKLTIKDLQLRVQELKHEKNILVEREKQVEAMYKLNNGNLPFREFQKLKNDELLKENQHDLTNLKKQNDKLMKEIEQMTYQIDSLNAEQDIKRETSTIGDFDQQMANMDTNQLIFEIEQQEARAKNLQEEVISLKTQEFAREMAELKSKKVILDNLIQANSDYNYYTPY